MKTISIEQVTNGWIVRPFNPGTWSCVEAPAMSVFTDMAAMQAALPQFFEMPDPLVPVHRDCQPFGTLGDPPPIGGLGAGVTSPPPAPIGAKRPSP